MHTSFRSCYFYSGDVDIFVSSYEAATNFCWQEGGNLATVKSGEENRAILEHFLSPSMSLLITSANLFDVVDFNFDVDV